MSESSHFSRDLQRKFVVILLAITAIIVILGVPLILFDHLRLDVAHQLGIAPGRDAEQLAGGDDGATLVVLPLGDYAGTGRELYRYKAQYIARPVNGGTELTDIDSERTLTIPLKEIDFIAADAEGEHVLFRGPATEGDKEIAILVNTAAATAKELPAGQDVPSVEGDWTTPVWEKTTGRCERYSSQGTFVACFNRADAANYLAGDWQIDVQLYGEYGVVEPVYRGAGFLPILGWAHNDTWIYFQNELGLWRIELPEDLLRQAWRPDSGPGEASAH